MPRLKRTVCLIRLPPTAELHRCATPPGFAGHAESHPAPQVACREGIHTARERVVGMWSPHYPPRPRYTVPRTAAHQSRDTRPAPPANLHTTWSSPGTSPVRVVTLSPISAVPARASASPVLPARPSVLHARPRGEVEVPFEQKRYTPAAPADSLRAEQGLNELHAYEENHRIAGETFQRKLATSRAARGVLFTDAEDAHEVPAGSHGASPPTPPFRAEQMLHVSRRGGGAFSPSWAAAVPSSDAEASPLPGSPSPSRYAHAGLF